MNRNSFPLSAVIKDRNYCERFKKDRISRDLGSIALVQEIETIASNQEPHLEMNNFHGN